jgi:eukaryotic-like serine/threonine-protein kinase
MSQPDKPVGAIFDAAVELPPERRAAYLHEACAGDDALRQRVEALLRAHQAAESFMTRPAVDPRPETLIVKPTEQPGDRIGRYKLLQQIGEGGCGVVYMAEQEEPVRRRVALKVIKLGMDTASVIARFEAERQALALMDHPNIAKVLDAGATQTGRPYFVMELVKAIPITRYCDENNLNTATRLSLFVQVCQAIQHAHQKGIIHRDIKPSNILVADHDGVPVPKIIDFGIAKATTDQRLTNKTVFTAFEQFIGTPAYMSPEQAKLSGLDIDTRSDIYSLGVLLYELLTGKTPFESKRLLEAGLDEVRRIIREEEPVRPSTKLHTLDAAEQTTVAKHRQSNPPKLEHAIRGDLDWIVMKALEKNRARRYETANSLAMDIQRHLQNEPVLARPPRAGYRLQKAWRRNKAAFTAALLMAAVLVAATAISASQAIRAKRAETLAKQRLAESEANAKLAKDRLAESEAISKFLTEVFQSPNPARDGRTITVAETLSNATRKLETELTNQPLRRAKLQAALGQTYHGLGLYREAIPLRERVRDFCLTNYGPEHTNTLSTMRDLALSYHDAGRRDEALKLREELLALCRKVNGPEHPATLHAMASLTDSYREAGRWVEALKLGEEVLEKDRKVLGPEDFETSVAMGTLANTYWEAGHRYKALKLREDVLALDRKISGPEQPDTLQDMNNLAVSYLEVGRRDEAVKLQEEALALYRKVSGPEHPATLNAMNNLAVSYLEVGRRDEALKLREEVLPLYVKALGPEHPTTLAAMNNLAISFDDAGRRDEALKLRQDVLALSIKRLGPEHPDTLGAMNNLAISYATTGRRDEALKLQEQVLALRRKVNGLEHADTLKAMVNLASTYGEAGRREEALKLREEALPLRRKVLGPEHPDTLGTMNDLASSYAEAGRMDEAIKLLEPMIPLSRKVLGSEHITTRYAMENLARVYDGVGRFNEGLKLHEECLALERKVLGPENPVTLQAMNALAWELATSDAADIRNGTNAVHFAEEVAAATHRKNASYLDTLAASYAEAQQFDKAVAVQQEAIGLAKSKQEKKDYESRLKLYQANKPCRVKANP